MQPQTESAIELFEQGLTKKDIAQMVSNSIEHILETGEVLKIAEAISCMEHFIKGVKDDPRFKEYVREETSKYPKGFVSSSGAKIECIESGVKYDYSVCEDTEMNNLNELMITIKEKIEERQKFLKTVPASGLSIVDKESGEMVTIYPPSKTSTSSFKVTLAK
jgi:hypothetical protein